MHILNQARNNLTVYSHLKPENAAEFLHFTFSKGGLGPLDPQPFSGLLVTMKGATPGTNGCFASHRIPSEFLLQDITGLLSTFRDLI